MPIKDSKKVVCTKCMILKNFQAFDSNRLVCYKCQKIPYATGRTRKFSEEKIVLTCMELKRKMRNIMKGDHVRQIILDFC
jgi:hypothetical protein